MDIVKANKNAAVYSLSEAGKAAAETLKFNQMIDTYFTLKDGDGLTNFDNYLLNNKHFWTTFVSTQNSLSASNIIKVDNTTTKYKSDTIDVAGRSNINSNVPSATGVSFGAAGAAVGVGGN